MYYCWIQVRHLGEGVVLLFVGLTGAEIDTWVRDHNYPYGGPYMVQPRQINGSVRRGIKAIYTFPRTIAVNESGFVVLRDSEGVFGTMKQVDAMTGDPIYAGYST